MHVVFDYLDDQQQSLGNFIRLIVNNDVMSNDPKIADFLLVVTRLFLQRVHEHAGVKHLRSIVSHGVIFIASQIKRLPRYDIVKRIVIECGNVGGLPNLVLKAFLELVLKNKLMSFV
jgi:hypothetical protein